jgi:hypothetical protein
MVEDEAAEGELLPLTEAPCRNCGDNTPGRFCRACGQKKTLHVASLREVVGDALEDQLSIATALPRTARGLIAHPGFLTREFLEGRIVRYIRPMRLYLLTSLMFFLALSFFGQSKQIIHVQNRGTADSTFTRRQAEARRAQSADAGDSREGGIHTGIKALDTRFNNNIRTLDTIDATSAARFLNRGLVQRGPTVMFLLLPFYALVLTLFYWGRAYYAQHFIYALHVHSFAFTLFTLMMMTPNNSPGVAVNLALFAWLIVYLFIAQKRVYGQGWLVTGVKYLAIGVIYMIAWAFGFILSVMIAVTLM